MSRPFTTADDEATLNATVRWRACLPPDHVARVIGDVITPRDLGALYARSGPRGGEAIAPDMRCGLWCDGAATGTCSARKIERATDASIPCHGLAGGLHPAHDPMAHWRTPVLPERQDLCVHRLLDAQAMGVLTVGHIRLDGTTHPRRCLQEPGEP